MRKNVKKLLCMVLSIASGAVMAAPLPQNILKQLPKGYAVLSFESGELNDDKLTDFIVVLRKNDEESISRKGSAPARPLLLFIQNNDGSYSLARRNDNVVFKINEGGQCDPFEDGEKGLAINKRYFTVQHSVACGQHWTDYITFRYAPELRDWVFHKRISESWRLNTSSDPNAEAIVSEGGQVVTGKGRPPVLFEKYREN